MGVQGRQEYTTLNELGEEITDMLHVYRSTVLKAIQDNMDECGDIFIANVKKISPPEDGPGIGGHYRDMWGKKKLSRAKYVVYVGNSKKVKRKNKDTEPAIPLINILEFSPNPDKHRPHVGTALNNSKDQIVNVIAKAIEKESK